MLFSLEHHPDRSLTHLCRIPGFGLTPTKFNDGLPGGDTSKVCGSGDIIRIGNAAYLADTGNHAIRKLNVPAETEPTVEDRAKACAEAGGTNFYPNPTEVDGELLQGCVRTGCAESDIACRLWKEIYESPLNFSLIGLYLQYDQAITYLQQISAGCLDAVGEFFNSILEALKQIGAFIADPQGFVAEKAEEIKAAIEAAVDDPTEVFLEIIEWDLLQSNPAEWVGKVGCTILIEFIIGAGAVKIAAKIDDFLARNRDRSDLCNSFPAGTPVLMADGTHEVIENIESGDRVLAYQTNTGTWSPQTVLRQWSHLDQGDIVQIRLADGSTVSATDHHQFRTQYDGWINAEDLRQGDLLVGPIGTPAVADITYWPEGPNTVWELTVDTDHTFAVSTGTTDLVVHNATCGVGSELPSIIQKSLERLDHLFRGTNGGGFHHRPQGFDPVTGGSSTFTTTIVKPPSGDVFPGVYAAWVKVKRADGTYRIKPSTFFPDDWNRSRVLKSIDEAYRNRTPENTTFQANTGNYVIEASDLQGNPIRVVVDPDGNLVTAFPNVSIQLGQQPTLN